MLRQPPAEVAFCRDDRIELDCCGALLDFLAILESLRLSPLGCPHERHALKARFLFFFPILFLISFLLVVLVLDYSLNCSFIYLL